MNIIDYIPTGIENAISKKSLCEKTGLPDRTVRQLIEKARRETIIVANNDGTGYWIYPDDPTHEEKQMLIRFVKQQESRAKSIFYALYPARKIVKGWANNGHQANR